MGRVILVTLLVLVVGTGFGAPVATETQATKELQALAKKVPGFASVALPKTGELALTAAQSLTSERLRGVVLDGRPPVLGERPQGWDPHMTDDYPAGTAPYVARDIAPFRFRYYNLEFNYGGWHNWGMAEYAVTHGFNILYPYNSKPEDWPQVPKGTQWLRWGGFVNWDEWLPKHGLKADDWGQVLGMDLAGKLVEEKVFAPNPGYDYMMVDIEHWCRPEDNLRAQPWYPKDASAEEKAAFEKRYYEGYARTNIACMEAARKAGYKNLSIYGWAPVARGWYGLENATVNPQTDFAWNAYGKAIYDAVDVLNPSVYAYYWCAQNVAYTLASVDLNVQLRDSCRVRKPLHVYYWTLLHGGGTEQRWWKDQPIPTEEARAMMALFFFTGAEGLDQWNWSGTGDHHHPAPFQEGAQLMVGQPFSCVPAGAADAQATDFARYDMLVVKQVAGESVTFALSHKNGTGLMDQAPETTYVMKADALRPLLRSHSEAMAGVIEGLALARPLEYVLRHGKVMIDVPAQEQFAKTLPIVRRVKLGQWQVLATYDPAVVYGGKPREITLNNFDGHKGLTLKLPADEQVRVWVVRG